MAYLRIVPVPALCSTPADWYLGCADRVCNIEMGPSATIHVYFICASLRKLPTNADCWSRCLFWHVQMNMALSTLGLNGAWRQSIITVLVGSLHMISALVKNWTIWVI